MPIHFNPLKKSLYQESGAQKNNLKKNPLIQYFDRINQEENSPFEMATTDLQDILDGAKTETQLLQELTRATVESSLTASVDEKFLEEIQLDNPVAASSKIQMYINETAARKLQLKEQTLMHLGYIQNYAYCPGCAVCEFHHDVRALVSPYEEKDIEYFIQLFVGMKTINYSFELIIADYLKNNPNTIPGLNDEMVWSLRVHVFNKAESMYKRLVT